MPKRKIKEEKPRKKITRKQLLLPPILVGVATVAGIIFMMINPPPSVIGQCLKGHESPIHSFNLYPRIEIFLEEQKVYLPSDVGKGNQTGKECIRVIHTDKIGNEIHIEYVRPVRLTMNDFMQIYSNNTGLIKVFDNATEPMGYKNLTLANYDILYSYFSEDGKFTVLSNISEFPPFQNNMLVRMNLSGK